MLFHKFKNYLADFNMNNSFILYDAIGLKILKELAITNNEVVYMTHSKNINLSKLCSGLVNRVISFEYLIITE